MLVKTFSWMNPMPENGGKIRKNVFVIKTFFLCSEKNVCPLVVTCLDEDPATDVARVDVGKARRKPLRKLSRCSRPEIYHHVEFETTWVKIEDDTDVFFHVVTKKEARGI